MTVADPLIRMARPGDASVLQGKHYLATGINLYSRRILGNAMGAHHDAGRVVAALNMAPVSRGGLVA